jgi:hypothetical protein
MQWSATLRPCSIDELRMLTTNLLSELERTDVAVVDRSTLQLVFQPLISAARHELAEARERHKTLLARRYGTEAGNHLMQVDALDAPDVLDTFNSQRLGQLEAVVNHQARRIADVERKAALTAKDKEELERLRQAARQRRMKAKSQKRSAATKQRRRRKSG